jgi:hypothetical protein
LASAFKLFKIQGQLANKFGIEQERDAFITNLKTIASNQSETNRPKWCFKTVDVRRGSVGCCNDGIVCFSI